jgi:hypothetical protein
MVSYWTYETYRTYTGEITGIDTSGRLCSDGHRFFDRHTRGLMEDRETRSQLRCGIKLQCSA